MKKLPIKRIDYFDKKLPNKEYLTPEEFMSLFNGIVRIDEKIDGHAEFHDGVYSEKVKYKHTIHYTKLPKSIVEYNYNVVLDLDAEDDNGNAIITSTSVKSLSPPCLFYGKILFNRVPQFLEFLMNQQSIWSDDKIEGIVVKNYKKQIFGKISRFDFSKEIDKNHIRKPKVLNRIGNLKLGKI